MEEKRPELTLSDDGRRITVTRPLSGVCHEFELVDRIPLGYSVWNIGKNMADGYLPLCRLAAIQPFPGGRNIEADTLKAIKCEGAQLILAAVGWGPETPKQMEQYIKKNEKNPHKQFEVKRMKKALPFMRKLKWD